MGDQQKPDEMAHGSTSEKMNKQIFGSVLLGPLLAMVVTVAQSASPVIILDSGHDPLYVGARAVCGEFEYVYNDRIVATYLKTASVRMLLTRAPGQSLTLVNSGADPDNQKDRRYSLKSSLQARVHFANANQGHLFISIHHDSVASRFITQDENLCHGKGGHKLVPEFSKKHDIGFNVFVYQDEKNSYYRDSLRFAKLLADELQAMGRKPSTYHYFPEDDCRSCRPVIRELGIWHQQLYVLRHVQMPAVLVEVGNIIDVEDEARINTDQFRQQFAQALDKAVQRYFSKGASNQLIN